MRQWLWTNFVGYKVLKMLPFVAILTWEGCSNAIKQDSNHTGAALPEHGGFCPHPSGCHWQWDLSTSLGSMPQC